MNYWAFERWVAGQNPKERKKTEKEEKRNQKTSVEIELIQFVTFVCITIVENKFIKVGFCFVLALQAKDRNST